MCSKTLCKLSFITLLILASCAPIRTVVPPGTVPDQSQLRSEDEQYGQEVLNQLLEQYKLDDSDERINRVRDLVDRLASAASAQNNPWHVWVLVDDSFVNAAATRGNFIFIWTGMLKAAGDDYELATVLAHEIAHLLAGHTAEDPSTEVNDMLSSIAGLAVGQVVAQRGVVGPVADLAEVLVREVVAGLIVNPSQQRNELEADHIGLFLMAKSGIDPQKGFQFWERAAKDPRFAGHPIPFFSSHPTNEERLNNLRKHLPAAIARYNEHLGSSGFAVKQAGNEQPEVQAGAAIDYEWKDTLGPEKWIVLSDEVSVYALPDIDSNVLKVLSFGAKVNVASGKGGWLKLSEPVSGYIRKKGAAREP